jgi:hypothetical protein
MKVNFSKNTHYVPEFNDNKILPIVDQISAEVSPLPFTVFLDIRDVLAQSSFTRADLKDLTTDQLKLIVGALGKYVPAYVVLNGLEGFTVEDVVNYTPFFPLAVELLFALINASTPNEADLKNS